MQWASVSGLILGSLNLLPFLPAGSSLLLYLSLHILLSSPRFLNIDYSPGFLKRIFHLILILVGLYKSFEFSETFVMVRD